MSHQSDFFSKVMAMHDMCSYGRSSLTVVTPVLSVLGCQVCPLPTALLSTHLGFPEPTILNLGEELKKILTHWKTLDLRFDCFYSGYLASPEQVDIAKDYVKHFSPGFIFVDPVLGDGGSYYTGFDRHQGNAMRKLFTQAQMGSPNVTEACILLEEPLVTYIDTATAKKYLQKLSALGPAKVCITGVPNPDGKTLSSYGYNAENDSYYKVTTSSVPVNLHGTGDSFASVLVGLTLQGVPFDRAMLRASSYLHEAAKLAYTKNEELCIEQAFPTLLAGSESAVMELL